MLGLESEILIKYKRIIWTPRALLFRTYSHGENSSYPTMERAKRIQWGPLDSLSILFALMNRTWVFKNRWYILLFSYLENIYHAKGRGRYEPSAYVCGLNKKPDYLYFFQKLERKVKKSSQFCVVIFQFHVLQQMER